MDEVREEYESINSRADIDRAHQRYMQSSADGESSTFEFKGTAGKGKIDKDDKTRFARGYDVTFTDRLYRISEIKRNLPIVMYKVKPVSLDAGEEELKGSFYQAELQEIGDTDYYVIEKIVKKYPKKKLALIKWLGFDESYNSLVPMDQIKTLKELVISWGKRDLCLGDKCTPPSME